MFTRILLATFMSATAVTAITGCQRPSSPPAVITATSQAPASAAPTGAALTRQACELLTPEVAKKYAGTDAQRQLFFDATPPLPVGDDGCYYTGSTREVSVLIYPMPTDPTAPVNHFHVIRADNRGLLVRPGRKHRGGKGRTVDRHQGGADQGGVDR